MLGSIKEIGGGINDYIKSRPDPRSDHKNGGPLWIISHQSLFTMMEILAPVNIIFERDSKNQHENHWFWAARLAGFKCKNLQVFIFCHLSLFIFGLLCLPYFVNMPTYNVLVGLIKCKNKTNDLHFDS